MTARLSIEGLEIRFRSRRGDVAAVRGIDLEVAAGEILGVVGESGAGKSTIGNAAMGLIEPPGEMSRGTIRLEGEVLPLDDPDAMRGLRGDRIAMIFQDPQTSLNPLMTIADQLVETMRTHLPIGNREARRRAESLLDQVGIPDPASRMDDYPHQFSGGMRQRVVIALALCADPEMIIADEPTTALDVSIQAQILGLLRGLVRERGVGMILITHDMG
ncbi:MAG: ABC transporter ATP-binding protein, partial [Pseudomonadota bacterium]